MSVLQSFIGTPLAGSVGWTLLHSLWEGVVVSAVLAAVLMIARSPRIRYAAACISMLTLIGGFVVTLIHLVPDGLRGAPISSPSAIYAWNAAMDAGASGRWYPSLGIIAPWLAPFWFAGVLLFSARHLAGFLLLRRLRRRGICHTSARWQREVSRLGARLHLSRPARLMESSLAEVPVVLGWLRPLILVPAGLLSGLPPEQMEAILLHELAHIRRHDYLVNVFQRLADCLFLYHPAAWWISRVIDTEREYCCDDLVIGISGDAHRYASALAALEENRWSGREPAIAASGGSLVKRIRRLLYPNTPKRVWTPLGAAVMFVAAAAMAFGAWQSNFSASSPPEASANAMNYSKWLNEDVVYIITAQERAAFQKLTTDAERNEFARQFWQRRDPTPGTPENEFKKEHYRRRAYANLHWGSASEPGWKTDRGHMFIVYGPPDEIESHPATAQGRYGTEIWFYRHIEGISDKVTFTFIDRTGQGDYQLAPGPAR